MTDTVERARRLAIEARDLQATIEELETRTDANRKRLNVILTGELVDTMNEAGLDTMGIPSDGNMPAVDVELSTFVSASIPKSWDEQRRDAAFDMLPGDLVKVAVSVMFTRFEREQAEKLAKELINQGHTVVVERTCHFKTLESWLRQQLEQGEPLPDLPTIGATIGTRAKLKRRD